MKSDNKLPQNTRISQYSFKRCVNNIVIGVVNFVDLSLHILIDFYYAKLKIRSKYFISQRKNKCRKSEILYFIYWCFTAWIDIVTCKQHKNVKYVKYQYRNHMDLIIFRIIGKF